MCLGKNTAQAANVRRSHFGCAVRCSGLQLFEKMLAFLREPVDFVDRLKKLRWNGISSGVFCLTVTDHRLK